MPKLIPIVSGGQTVGYRFWCVACRALHPLYVVSFHGSPYWWFNGDLERPQFSPSLRMIQENNCHLYVSDGVLCYCNDCKHELRGQNVPMVDFDVERWKPVVASKKKEAPKEPSKTHKPECGDVGITGDHGDLGSNALNQEESASKENE